MGVRRVQEITTAPVVKSLMTPVEHVLDPAIEPRLRAESWDRKNTGRQYRLTHELQLWTRDGESDRRIGNFNKSCAI